MIDEEIAATERAIASKERLENFLKLYSECLVQRIRAEPSRYIYGLDKVPDFVAKMREAVPTSEFHIGAAMVDTCRTLGINATHKAIQKYLGGNDERS